MADPFSITAFGLSVLGGCLANWTDAPAKAGWQQLSRQLERARSAGKLPANHHIERGTSRACLKATQICIQQLIDTNNAEFLNDISNTVYVNGEKIDRNIHSRDPDLNTTALSALQKKLHKLIKTLEPRETHATGSRNQKRLEDALVEAALPISGSALEQYGGKTLSSLNTAPETTEQTATPISINEIRFELLPDLENAVIQQALDFGHWSPSRCEEIAEGIRSTFFGEDELWATSFALSYADELRKDTNLYRMAVFLRLERLDDALSVIESSGEVLKKEVENFAQNTQAAFEDLSVNLQNIHKNSEKSAEIAEQTLKQLKNQLAFNGRKVFSSFKEIPNTFKPFYFAEEEDAFTGRDDVLKQLNDKLLNLHTDVPPFLWAAVCGDAGSGKSRLALHVLKSCSDTWRLSGFVRRGFITSGELALDSLSGITGPTLFIIDYAGNAPEACCRFIERCALLAEDAPFPVRVIVLLRRTNDRFFEFVREQEDGAIAINTQVKPDEHDDSGALILSALKEEETLELMRNRIRHAATPAESEKEISDDDLATLLSYYDEQKRPLFALMVADAYQKGLIKESPTDVTQEEARLTLFWDYLEHQFVTRWKKALGSPGSSLNTEDQERIDRHVTFLILSTMCRGLTNEGWQQLVDDKKLSAAAKGILPHSPFIFADNYGEASALLNETLLTEFSGALPTDVDQDFYQTLEPDLIGEALVLLVLNKERGKNFCLQTGTDQRRIMFLRNFAWTADPEGAAFFSVLATQDYPKKAAELKWLLPDKCDPDTANVRMQLFRNLVLAITGRFRLDAATLEDVQQIEQLIETFRPIPTDPKEIQLEFLVGLVHLAEHLSFMVNKTTFPRGVAQSPAFSDKLGRRKLEFGRAASDPACNAKESETNQSNDEEIYQFRSKPEAISAALSLLRRLYNDAIEPAFSNSELDIRHQHARIVAYALFSVFWKYRDKGEKFGFAATPPSEEEITERNRLADRCNSALDSSTLDEDTLAIICSLIYSIIYSEHGEDESRGKKVFEAICDKTLENGFTKTTSIQLALKFIGNHSYNEIAYELNKKGVDNYRDFTAIRNAAEKLIGLATKLPSIPENTREQIADGFLDVCRRVAWYDEQRNHDNTEYMEKSFTLFMEFVESQGPVPIGDDAIDFFSTQFNAHNQRNTDATEALINYSNLADRSRFDQQSLNRPSWESLRYHLLQLAYMPNKNAKTVQKLIKKLIDQVGPRVNRDLIDMIQTQIPDPMLSQEIVDNFATLGCSCSHETVSTEKRSNLKLALLSQHLLFGDDDNKGFNDLEKLWTLGNSEEDFTSRISVFQSLQMLIWWYGLEHNQVKEWRQRLLNFLDLDESSTDKKLSAIQHSHHQAALATAATFATLEISAGRSPDDWLLLTENC